MVIKTQDSIVIVAVVIHLEKHDPQPGKRENTGGNNIHNGIQNRVNPGESRVFVHLQEIIKSPVLLLQIQMSNQVHSCHHIVFSEYLSRVHSYNLKVAERNPKFKVAGSLYMVFSDLTKLGLDFING